MDEEYHPCTGVMYDNSQVEPQNDQEEDQWAIYVREFQSERKIFCKVAPYIRRVKPEAYAPFAFSFGPDHSKGQVSKPKDSYQDYYKTSSLSLLKEGEFLSLVKQIQMDEAMRAFCAKGPEVEANTPQELAEQLARDAVFIVAYFVTGYCGENSDVRSDCILLENQLPLLAIKYAIEKEWKFTLKKHDIGGLERLANEFVKRYSPFCQQEWKIPAGFLDSRMHGHLMLCLYDALTSRKSSGSSTRNGSRATEALIAIEEKGVLNIPTASKLRRSGIRFRGCDGNFTGIHFDKKAGKLFLPRITVDHSTERILRNILAYELEISGRHPQKRAVRSYLYVMDGLINKDADVELLTEKKVLKHCLGSHRALAEMWNGLCKDVPMHVSCYDGLLVENVNEYCSGNNWIGRFMRWEFFWEKKPWWPLSVVAATILLVLTLLQTIYIVKTYQHP